MLVLSRKVDDRIQIGDDITLVVVSISGDKVRLGIEAPREIEILRPDAIRKFPREREKSGEEKCE